jgi:hypothetical protein
MKKFGASSLAVIAVFAMQSTLAASPQIIDVAPGQTEDAYFQINLSGKVFVVIAAKPGDEACADFWWVTWPLGRVESLGRHCNSASFPIPGVLSAAISSKLRVGGVKNKVKIGISANEEVAHNLKFTF